MKLGEIISTKSHVMDLWLVFEASLIHIVQMHSTRLSRVVTSFKHVYLTLYVECVLKKQLEAQEEWTLCIKPLFQNGNVAFLPKMVLSTGNALNAWIKASRSCEKH